MGSPRRIAVLSVTHFFYSNFLEVYESLILKGNDGAFEWMRILSLMKSLEVITSYNQVHCSQDANAEFGVTPEFYSTIEKVFVKHFSQLSYNE
jgi:hypothetical protein